GRLFPGKRGKAVDQRRHSPQGLAMMAKQGTSGSHAHRANHRSCSPTPLRDDYPPRSPDDNSPNGSDEGDPWCPLSRNILRAPIPKGFERYPSHPAYDGLTDPDD
ncbi:hypothetical protein L195_g062197, partial [Trifolium pratense]